MRSCSYVRIANSKTSQAGHSLFAIRHFTICLSAPDLFGDLDHLTHLRPLLLLGEDVAFLGRGEAALRAERELLERGVLRGLVDAALDQVFRLERAALRGDHADHDDLLALGQEAQRLETAGAVAVVFQEIAVEVALAE